MRKIVLLDTKIDKDEAIGVLNEYAAIYKQNAGVVVDFFIERRDFSVVPTVPDKDGDLKPTAAFRKGLETEIHKRYGDYGADNILMWVHEDNFLYKGIWGSAWAYNFFKYSFLLCRWDKKNKTNTLFTLFHEGEHPVDTLLLKELGIDINPLLKKLFLETGTKADIAYIEKNGFSYDRDYVHGGLPSLQYIGRKGYTLSKTNLKVLNFLAPYLQKAYTGRKNKHFAPVTSLQKQLISVLKSILNIK